MTKKILVISLTAAAIFVALFFILRKPKHQGHKINPEFSKYVDAFTSGTISKKSTIKIKVTDFIADKIKRTDESVTDIFDFEPSIKGNAAWTDNNTIEFKPESDLPSGKEYTAEFNIEKLLDVPSEFEKFNFSFETVSQNLEVEILEIQTIDKKSFTLQKIIGKIITSDSENKDNISKTIAASQEGKSLIVKVAQLENAMNWQFEIDSITRFAKNSDLRVSWNGEALGVKKSGEEKIEIPGLSDFKLLFHKVIQSPEQYIQLQFSDPLPENQFLNGLVNIQDIAGCNYVTEGNIIKVFPPKHLNGKYFVSIEEGIQNINEKRLGKSTKIEVHFEDVKPAVRFVDNGVVLPESENGLIVPFEAINLKAVDVKITKIYENNITQFLQENDYNGSYELKRVSKAIVKKTIRLDQTNIANFGKWNRFSLDLNKLIKTDPGAIYRISIAFRKKYAVYNCTDTPEKRNSNNAAEENAESETVYENETPENYDEDYYWDQIGDGGYYGYYYGSWEDRDNPCKESYYNSSRFVSKNVIASNLGVIAKKGNDGSVRIFVTDLRTTQPLSDVKVEILDFQKQVLGTSKTNKTGIADFSKIEDAFFLIASYEKQKTYLKLNDGASLSLSRFDVSGASVEKGLKGFMYGERGVWRPGDSIYLSFILQENADKLPDHHPIVFELRNPQFQLTKRIVEQISQNGFYTFRFKTLPDAPTGNWEAKILIGGISFTKTLKIENIKPNRLKINLDFGRDFLAIGNLPEAKLNSKWLHGSPAKNLKATVNMILSPVKTNFEKFKDYDFDDQSKKYYSESITIFEGKTDENGNISFQTKINNDAAAPGKMSANFITKVFENGGNFSIDQFSLPYFPYKSFIGIKAPEGDKNTGMLVTDTVHKLSLICVDSKGNLINEQNEIELELYKLEWRWWWERSEEELSNYTGRSYIKPLQKSKVYTQSGKASWDIRINYPDWGRYLVKAKNLTSGHSTSTVVYLDWPGWIKREQKDHAGGATMLAFTTDKEKYTIGEKINITIPSSKGGRALINIENGSRVIESYWVETLQGQTQYSVNTNEKMAPNIYISVTLLQPHAQTKNDLPIRMYGIQSVIVENPETHLEPVITMPAELTAETSATVKVKEKNRKDMTYTLAIVDEGLLDLTRFKTPDPWNYFYAKEALGVITWDIFDWVIGAYGGELERLLSIGGDGSGGPGGNKKANRFKPMVKFLGPFELKSGSENTHKIDIPAYIGSVRTMVIAGKNKKYGFAEKATPVTKPLMVLGTLPRVLGPGETLKLPVTVFAMKDHIKNASVKITCNELLSIQGKTSATLIFPKKGEQNAEFDLAVNNKLGIAKVKIEAASGNEKSVYEMELDIRNPNPKITDVYNSTIEAGDSWNLNFKPAGMDGTNSAFIEISSIPPINLNERLKYLIAYPHGCVEQTTSAAFPQLYLSDIMELSQIKKDDISRNIKAAIQKLQKFQMGTGALSYWAGGNDACEWGTSYAGHFLLEAEKKGYIIPSEFMKKWAGYQTQKARSWVDDGNHSQLNQAYRLYSLALADKPEIGAMNRLREKSNISDDTKWRLAAAYQISGKTKIAAELVKGLDTNIPKYNELDYTFGSDVRDKAMILETLGLLEMKNKAYPVLKELSEELSKNNWMSTQTTAYALIAVTKFMAKNASSSEIKYSYKMNNSSMESKNTRKGIHVSELEIKTTATNNLVIKNNSTGVLFARVITSGVPLTGETKDADNGLKMAVVYKKLNGEILSIDNIPGGTDFMAEVSITNTGTQKEYKQIALSQIFPSGWEIINTRMLDAGSLLDLSVPTYQDIKDDRVYTYFDISKGRTKTFRVMLNASYSGRYYLPAIVAEAMYDNTINSRRQGKWVIVTKN